MLGPGSFASRGFEVETVRIVAGVAEEDVVEGLGLETGLCRTYVASNPRSFPKWLDLKEVFKVCRKQFSGMKKGHYLEEGGGINVGISHKQLCRAHVSGPGG